MKAFVSYSLNDSEEYILTILSRKLREQGFSIVSSYREYRNTLDYETFSQLSKSNLFIGVITKKGQANKQVFAEWREATKRQIPALLLIEENVNVTPYLRNQSNVLFFNRHRPEVAIEAVRTKITRNNQRTISTRQRNDNSAAWILGGLAALAIIGLLANDD